MKTSELLKIIGEPVSEFLPAPPFGNGTIHANGYASCDPCYLWEYNEGMREAHRLAFPWENYDYKAGKESWREFVFEGERCFARDCSDGAGYFGNSVDAGYVFAFPVKFLSTKKTSEPK